MFIRLIFLFLLTPASFAAVSIINRDDPGEGLNDTTAVAAVGGNTGTTLGQQRLNVFNKAADILNTIFKINQPVKVSAKFDPLLCVPATPTTLASAVLGQAGPANYQFQNNSGEYTVYPDALYNQLQNRDVDSNKLEITATFNSRLDSGSCLGGRTWYYGYSDNGGSNTALLPVVLHEIMHGMGFLSLLDGAGKSGASVDSKQVFDIYTKMLKRQSSGVFLKDMSQADRAAAVVSNGDLVWSGAKVNAKSGNYSAGTNGGSVRIFAPAGYRDGSSLGHFDPLLSPNEMMEPRYTQFTDNPGLATQLLEDIGWTLNSANSAPTLTPILNQSLLQGTTKQVRLSATDPDTSDSLLRFRITAKSPGLSASITANTLTIDASNGIAQGDYSAEIEVSDGSLSNRQVVQIKILPRFNLQQGSTKLEDGGTLKGSTDTIAIGINGGDNQLTVNVFFNGQDQSGLLTRTRTGYQLQMPARGAFAGTYRLDVSDQSGHSARYFIERPLRVVSNVSTLLDSASHQQIFVEGAPSGSQIDLSVNNQAITFSAENNRITASNNAEQFHRAVSALTLSRNPSDKAYEITAQSTNLPKGTKEGVIATSKSVTFTVKTSDGNMLQGAVITSNDTRLTEWQLPRSATTNTNGIASLTLASEQQTITITAPGYSSRNVSLSAANTTLAITLNKIETPFSITGSIISQGVDFIAEAPRVTLFFTNGTQEILATQVNSSGNRATFAWQGDRSQKTPERVNIRHSKANEINKTIIASAPSVFISGLLIANPVPQQQNPIVLTGSASGSGAEPFLWLLLFVTSFAFHRRKSFTCH